MANQPESITYDAGVLQLETTTPVQGGVGGASNAPLLNLANRTAYLKSHVDSLEAGTTIPPTVAPLNSPTFTGDPKAPTPALNDNDTSIATSAFVQGTVNGVLAKSVAGGVNVTLTTIEAGNALFIFSGVLTANIAVIIPAAGKQLMVQNRTTGAFTLTVKTPAGTGIVVAQNLQQELVCDGTNVLLASNDFTDVALIGAPTAPTPAVGDNTTKIATTAYVQRNAVPVDFLTGAALIPLGTTAQRTAAAAGKFRFNTDTGRFEGNNGTAWGSLGGATGGGNDAVFYLNDQTINNSYTVASNQNAMSAGPITIANGQTITVSDGAVWSIV